MYYNITAYEWFQGKREDVEDDEQIEQTVRLRNVSMEDAHLEDTSPVQYTHEEKHAPSPVIMKIIPSKGPKAPKVKFVCDVHTTSTQHSEQKCSQGSQG